MGLADETRELFAFERLRKPLQIPRFRIARVPLRSAGVARPFPSVRDLEPHVGMTRLGAYYCTGKLSTVPTKTWQASVTVEQWIAGIHLFPSQRKRIACLLPSIVMTACIRKIGERVPL